MPKINVYLPDDLAEAVKESGVPVSAVCQRALEQAVRRITAIRETALATPDNDEPAARLTHFTARARTVVNLSLDHARATGAPTIGTRHLLSALLAEGANLAMRVLPTLEINPEQVQRELTRRTHAKTDTTEDSTARQFTATAANALELTVAEATALGHNYVGCEHLLLGLITEPEGTAGQVLRSLGAEYRLTRHAVTAALAGYVHLQTQAQPATTPTTTDPAKLLTAAIRQELQPVLQRLERLEEHIGVRPEH